MAFVISAGTLLPARPAPLASPDGSYAGSRIAGSSLSSTGVAFLDRTIAYETIYRTQPAVRSVVDFLGRNIATLGAGLYRGEAADRSSLRSSPLGLMLRKPQPNRSRFAFYRALVSDVATFDAWLAVKVVLKGTGRTSLLRIPPPFVDLIGTDWAAPQGFKVTDGRGRVLALLDPSEVVYITGYSPGSEARGVSPMETLRSTIAEEAAAQSYRRGLWRNGARVGSVITRPADAPKWGDPARERFLEDWRAAWTGDTDQAGGTPILEEGMQLHKVAMTSVEAEYISARKFSREEVFSLYHVDPRLVGLPSVSGDDASTRRGLYADTFGPWCSQIGDELSSQLIGDYADLDADTDYVELNLEGKLRGHFLDQAEVISRAVGAPWLVRDEARAMFNRAPLPDGAGAEVITPLNVTLGGRASPADTAPGAPGLGQVAPPKVLAIGSGRKSLDGTAGAGLVARWQPWHRKTTDELAAVLEKARASTVSRLGAGQSVAAAVDVATLSLRLEQRAHGLALAFSEAEAAHTIHELGADPADYDAALLGPAFAPGSKRYAANLADLLLGSVELAVSRVTAKASSEAASAADDAFSTFIDGRLEASTASRTTAIGNSTRADVAEKVGSGTKTWRVHSSNPRASHARLSGETVPIGSTFSNGARWPGDASLPPSERANCTCTVDFSHPVTSPAEPAAPTGFAPDDEVRYGHAEALAGQARFVADLTSDEAAAIRRYTGTETADRINGTLNGGYELDAADTETVRLLDEAIAKAPTFDDPVTVYRGVSADPPDLRFGDSDEVVTEKLIRLAGERFAPGSTISLGDGFVSTSTLVNPALDASLSRRSPGLVFEILANRGAPISSLSRYDDEAELLLARGSRFRVVRIVDEVTYDRDLEEYVTRVTVQLEQVA